MFVYVMHPINGTVRKHIKPSPVVYYDKARFDAVLANLRSAYKDMFDVKAYRLEEM
jgi:type III secretory pathway component EscR